ncbi:subclass B3 metallo-beta-lactamase [Massilia soli]|nr:subclass B3 metallo-beta-lactamase [Massilia soli]
MTKAATLALALAFMVSGTASAAWNDPQKPFNVSGNTWYVGTKELSAILITSPQGHVLLDGAVPASAPFIEKNIRELGFKVEDIKLILNSHAHIDHAGGIAALQRASGALVAASAHGAQVLGDGTIGKDDPQFTAENADHFPKVAHVKVLSDGEVLTVGPISVTAHMTPGHTPGSASYSWTSCDGARCLDVVYADSLTAISLGDYRYLGGKGAPDVSKRFQASIDKIGALKCDVLLTTHPGASGMMEKLAAKTPAQNTFINDAACRELASRANAGLATRLATERGEKPAPVN